MIKKFLFISLIYLFWSACQQTDLEHIPIVYDYSYFPIDSGAWREFEVTKIVIDEASQRFDTSHSYLLEKWAGLVFNTSNDSMMRLELYTRNNKSQPWTIATVWQASIVNHEAIQVEENIRYLKLAFPVELNKKWNGNKYNRLDTLIQHNYEIDTIDIPYSLNGLVFDSILTVVQKDQSSFINKLYFEEKYANGIGLIEKRQMDLYSKIVDTSIPIENRITKGTIYIQKIMGYGNK